MNNYPKITLTKFEAMTAATIGIWRNLEVMYGGMGKRNYINNPHFDAWKVDIEAAAAEMAYAKFRGQYWDFSVNTFKKPDVGKAQVRNNQYPNGHLIIRPVDNPDEYFVYVMGAIPEFYIVGWIQGQDARQDEFIRSPHDPEKEAWFVPQNALNRF